MDLRSDMKISEDPGLMARWDTRRNTEDPSKISVGNSRTKVYWKCEEHPHSSIAVPSYFNSSRRCAVCYGRQVWRGFNDFASVNPERSRYWDYSKNEDSPQEIAKSSNKKRWFICDKGHSFSMALNSISSGRWCPDCAGNSVITGVNDIFTLRPDLRAIWDFKNNPEPATVAASSGKKVSWVCEKYGHTWEATPSHVGGCPICGGYSVLAGFNDFLSQNPRRAIYWDRHKNTDLPENIHVGSGSTRHFTCEEGHSFSRTLYDVKMGKWCPYCEGRLASPGNNLQDLHPDIAEEWDSSNNYAPEEVLPQSNYKAVWQCKVNSDHRWEAFVYSRTYGGSSCPKCNPAGSITQHEVASYVRSILPESTEVIEEYRGLCGRGHVDIYIPEHNIAIEYNGLWWHREEARAIPVSDKVRMCSENGVDLYVIWEDDWVMRREIVHRWLRNLLGVSEDPKVNARDCIVDPEVSRQESMKFLTDNHIQGHKNGSIRAGLRVGGDLVALAVYTRRGDYLYLDRYATSKNVRGGFTKLQAWVDGHVPYSHMITFADLTYSRGRLYKNTGWIEQSEIAPDYSYVYKGQRHHKFNFRISRFRKDPSLNYQEGMTERELAALNKLYRVYDAGKIKYTRSNPLL